MESFKAFTEKLREEKELCGLVEFFKMLGNPTRIHILLLLMTQAAWHDAVGGVPSARFIKVQ